MLNLTEVEKELINYYRNTLADLKTMTFDVARQNAVASRVIKRKRNKIARRA